jgi:hypothetical protein
MAEKLAALAVMVGLSLAAIVTWEGDLPTVWMKLGEADDPKLKEPEYVTLTVRGDCSTRRPGMEQVAVPPLRVTLSAVVPPLLQLGVARCPGPFVGTGSLKANVTLPDGVPVAGATGLTVAVKVSGCPATAGFTGELTAVVVDPLPTESDVEPFEPAKSASPP